MIYSVIQEFYPILKASSREEVLNQAAEKLALLPKLLPSSDMKDAKAKRQELNSKLKKRFGVK